MNTEEKLSHFYDITLEAASRDAQQMIDAHKAALNEEFQEHKESQNRQCQTELKTASDKIKRDFNKEISDQQLKIRQKRSSAKEELSSKLFSEVEEKLSAFRKSPDYLHTLCQQIKAAETFADGDDLLIYMDPEDAHLVDALSKALKDENYELPTPLFAEESFLGGTRAMIKEKNILIDHSFLTLLKDEKEQFQLEF